MRLQRSFKFLPRPLPTCRCVAGINLPTDSLVLFDRSIAGGVAVEIDGKARAARALFAGKLEATVVRPFAFASVKNMNRLEVVAAVTQSRAEFARVVAF